MTEIQIWVRKMYERDGKFGKQYLILSTERLYYEQNKPFPKEIGEGSDVLLEAEASKNPKYFKIKAIKAFNAHANPNSQVGEKKQAVAASNQSPSPAAQLPSLSPSVQAGYISMAKKALDIEFGKDWDLMICMPLLVELTRQYHNEAMSNRISADKRANIEKISKERGFK